MKVSIIGKNNVNLYDFLLITESLVLISDLWEINLFHPSKENNFVLCLLLNYNALACRASCIY